MRSGERAEAGRYFFTPDSPPQHDAWDHEARHKGRTLQNWAATHPRKGLLFVYFIVYCNAVFLGLAAEDGFSGVLIPEFVSIYGI